MSTIVTQLQRIYGPPRDAWDPSFLDEFEAHEVSWYRALPAELRTIAEFIVDEAALPHPRVRGLYGVTDLIEWNGDEGTFGSLRQVVEGYRYDRVVKIGDDTFLDVAGQVAAPGSVVWAIGHELDGAVVVAESLLALLEQAGVSSADATTPPSVTQRATQSSASAGWTPTSAQTCTVEGVTIGVEVPTSFAVQRDAEGFVARDAGSGASVGITVLPRLEDARGELREAALFDKTARTVPDDDGGGTVTTATATTRLLRAGGGFVRCYVKGGTEEERSAVCSSLRVIATT